MLPLQANWPTPYTKTSHTPGHDVECSKPQKHSIRLQIGYLLCRSSCAITVKHLTAAVQDGMLIAKAAREVNG
jgi:hypothetical protein